MIGNRELMRGAGMLTLVQSSRNTPASKADIAERVVVMCASALFSGLSERVCVEIASCGTARAFAREELLFLEGQQSRQLVMIQSGSVKVFQTSSNGEKVILRVDGPGDAVALPEGSRPFSHTSSASAMEQCRSLAWEYKQFHSLLAEFPQLSRNITTILSGRLGELQERLQELATERVARRLVLALLRLARQVGKPVAEGTRVRASREELAQLTGATLNSVSRLISKWTLDGFVLPGREEVIVLNAQDLMKAGDEGTLANRSIRLETIHTVKRSWKSSKRSLERIVQ